jgi:hypothetical protein
MRPGVASARAIAPGELAQLPRQITNPRSSTMHTVVLACETSSLAKRSWQLSASADAIESLPQSPALTPCALAGAGVRATLIDRGMGFVAVRAEDASLPGSARLAEPA